jgi:hypothetical protein
MRKFVSFSLLLALSMLVGCAASKGSGPNGTLTTAELKASLARSASDVQSASWIATEVVLVQLDEKERAEVGTFAYVVSSQVFKAADKGAVNIEDIKGLAQDLINRSGIKQKAKVGFLLEAITQVIEQHVSEVPLLAGDKAAVTRALIRAAAAGVQQATQSYGPPVTSVVPSNDPVFKSAMEDEFLLKWVMKPDKPYPWT